MLALYRNTCFYSTGHNLKATKIDFFRTMKFKSFFKNIPTHMDYEGQKLAERLFHIIILFFGAVGFAWGYYIQQFGATIIILAAGFIVSCLLVLPPWPMYRKHPLDWQKPRPEKTDTKREGGKKKQK